MKFLKVEDLTPNMMLVKSIYTNDGTLLLASNTVLNQNFIESIKRNGINKVYVYENVEEMENSNFYSEILSDSIRQQTVKSLKHLNVDAVAYLAHKIVNEIQEQTNLLIDLADMRVHHDYTYQHSVNVTIMAVTVGIGMGLDSQQLKDLAIGAILHDIGKMIINNSLLNKPSALTEQESIFIRFHPEFGYRMLSENRDINSVSKVAVLQHHENEDGSGYPYGKKGHQIHLFAKIIHVVDVFDALVSDRPYKKIYPPSEALTYLLDHVGTYFNKEIVDVFMKYVSIYPLGAKVKLSNGEFAIIQKNFQDDVLRPIVMLENGSLINLKEDDNYKNINVLEIIE